MVAAKLNLFADHTFFRFDGDMGLTSNNVRAMIWATSNLPETGNISISSRQWESASKRLQRKYLEASARRSGGL